MGEVVKLATSQPKAARACSTCRFYHPNVATWGTDFAGWFKPRVPSANARHFASCSFSGGDYAAVERRFVCQGDNWQPSD